MLLYFLRDMIQLILAPVKGWEDVSGDGFDSRELLTRGLIPFLVIVALSVFVRLFYVVDGTFVAALQQCIVCFLKYFASFFLASFVFTIYLPTMVDGGLNMTKCHTFIIYGIGLLALVNFIENIVPVELAIMYIMPVYVLYILWRAIRYMSVTFEGVGRFLIMTLCAVILPPYLIQYLFNLILPKL